MVDSRAEFQIDALDADNPTPLYYQIYLIYRQKILTGAFENGARLPSEEELSDAYGVSRITAKRSMNELATRGLVTRTRGRGTIVSHVNTAPSLASDFSGFVEDLIAIGTTTTVDVLSFEYVQPPDQIAQQMNLAPGTLTQRAERRRLREGVPFSHMTTHLPEDIGRTFERSDLSAKPILRLIEEAGHSIAEATQSIAAEPAHPIVAQALEVPIGSALLKVTRVVLNQEAVPVQHIEVLYRPDMYHLEMHLRRSPSEQGHMKWFSL
jgi:GntR family transcriptional regulator